MLKKTLCSYVLCSSIITDTQFNTQFSVRTALCLIRRDDLCMPAHTYHACYLDVNVYLFTEVESWSATS